MIVAAMTACKAAPMPRWAVSSPAELCGDPTLKAGDFCMPSARIERWLRSGHYTVTEAAVSTSGLTAPYKLRLQVEDGLTINVKFKRAPDTLEAFNNSPRSEIAAYELQKLFLDETEYVVPPTVLVCMPIKGNERYLKDLKPHAGEDCAVGVIAYWLENISDKGVIDPALWASNETYRDHLGNLNVLTVLIGHQDSIGDNFYRATDPMRPRLFAVDNGLAFGAMGANPIQWFSSKWSNVRVPVLPRRIVERLGRLDHAAFEKLRVVGQLDRKDGTLVPAPPTEPIDPALGVRRKGDIVQVGLTPDEITDVNLRLVKLLGSLDAGRLHESPP